MTYRSHDTPLPHPMTSPSKTPQAALPSESREWNARTWRLAGPIIIANLSTPLLGAVDTAVMGHLPDPVFIGAVALGAIIFNFIYWGFGFLRMATTGFTAQAFGAGDAAELRAALARPMILAGAFGLAVIALQVPITAVALWALDGSSEVEGLAADYTAIRIWSAPAALVNYAILGWLLGTQRAHSALLLQVIMNGLNIALDLYFVLGLEWGIEGVALATALSEIAAALLGLGLVWRILGGGGVLWDWPRLRRAAPWSALVRVNFDIFLRTLCLLIAFGYFTSLSARLGDLALAGNAILLQLFYFVAYGLDGFAHAAEILAGAAVGADHRDSFRQAVRATTRWALITALGMTVILLFAGDPIVELFTDIEAARAAAAAYLPWMVAMPLVSVWSFQLDGIFIGATRTAAMRNAMLLSLIFFVASCQILPPAYGNHGLWLALLLFMAARAVTLVWYYPQLVRDIEAAKLR